MLMLELLGWCQGREALNLYGLKKLNLKKLIPKKLILKPFKFPNQSRLHVGSAYNNNNNKNLKKKKGYGWEHFCEPQEVHSLFKTKADL